MTDLNAVVEPVGARVLIALSFDVANRTSKCPRFGISHPHYEEAE